MIKIWLMAILFFALIWMPVFDGHLYWLFVAGPFTLMLIGSCFTTTKDKPW